MRNFKLSEHLEIATFPFPLRFRFSKLRSNMNAVVLAYVIRLQKKYVALRKNKGEELQNFLDAPFVYPVVADARPKAIPPVFAGVGDENTLRNANVALEVELSGTKEQIQHFRRRSEGFRRERDSAKRKASRYDELRKRHKAEHEKAKYWMSRAEQSRTDASATTKLQYVEKQNQQLESHIVRLEEQIAELTEKLKDTRNEKVRK